MNEKYTIYLELPTVDDHLRLRKISGLTPRSEAAAKAGLPNTIIGAVVRESSRVVGIGRVVGDGLFYQIVDIAVDPDHQKKGIGKAIMERLMSELERQAPAEAYVSLIADGQAKDLYAQFGFAPTAPASIGMAQWLKRDVR
jgi:ribosomal protein S18 acetylase RimI-like enzyme